MTAEASPAAAAEPVPVERRVHDAVQAVPGVVRLAGGRVAEIATYLPGERIPGVRIADDVMHVHVVLQATGDLRAVADRIHETVRKVLADDGAGAATAVHVHVDDVELGPGHGTANPGPTGKERT